MKTRIGVLSIVGLVATVGSAAGQANYGPAVPAEQRVADQYRQQAAVRPDQPVAPQHPTLQRRPGPQQPFALTREQQAHLDDVLTRWEQHGEEVKTYEAKFTRWHYNGVFGDPNVAVVDQGEVKYASPDKGTFEVFGERPERWISDGKSIFEYDFEKKQLTEHKLPPELQGKAIADGPLPFIFGAKADKLKQRYFMRIVPANVPQGQVMLEALPKYQQDANSFQRAELILNTADMQPVGIQTHELNGKTRTVYRFESPKVNAKDPLQHLDPLRIFEKNPFKPDLPRGWTRVAQEPLPSQVTRQPDGAVRR